MAWNAKYGLLILFSTVVTYLTGLIIEYLKRQLNVQKIYKKVLLSICIILNMGILFYYKYINFLIVNVNAVFRKLAISGKYSTFDIILPVGVSFFVFQTIGYTIDVYRDEIKAEKNFFRYALFVSFFPQLVAGPIERSKNLLAQLRKSEEYNVENIRIGLLTMVFGIVMKVVVADNIAAVIDPVFLTPDNYSGMMLLFATILFAFQIYCDFNGYTQIAIGSARVLGINLNQNFNVPYMGQSIKDFWRRWHISLTSWFTDYLYIPLGGNKKGRIRKQINTMIVFICSGLWHGAAWHYVIWGGHEWFF